MSYVVHVTVEDEEFGEDFTVKVTVPDLIAAVRVGVESGTIKGEVRQTDNHGESVWMSERPFAPGTYVFIGPIEEDT